MTVKDYEKVTLLACFSICVTLHFPFVFFRYVGSCRNFFWLIYQKPWNKENPLLPRLFISVLTMHLPGLTVHVPER